METEGTREAAVVVTREVKVAVSIQAEEGKGAIQEEETAAAGASPPAHEAALPRPCAASSAPERQPDLSAVSVPAARRLL